MSSEVMAAVSGKRIHRDETNDRFLTMILDDPGLLEAEFAALVDGLEPGSGTGADAGQPVPSTGWSVQFGEADLPCPGGVEPAGCRRAAARPPPRTR